MDLFVLGAWGPYPAPGGACSGYLLTSPRARVLLELGNGTLSRLHGGNLPWEVDAVILSHLHWDHMADLMVLRYALDARGITLPLYSPVVPSTESCLLDYKGVYKRHKIEDGLEVTIGDMSVSFHQVQHPVPAFGVRVASGGRVFAYSSDTGPTPALHTLARGAHLFLCESNLLETQEAPGHLKASQAARAARDSGAVNLLLTHVAPGVDPPVLENEARTIHKASWVAQEGRSYAI